MLLRRWTRLRRLPSSVASSSGAAHHRSALFSRYDDLCRTKHLHHDEAQQQILKYLSRLCTYLDGERSGGQEKKKAEDKGGEGGGM